jgi:hypothetical protein
MAALLLATSLLFGGCASLFKRGEPLNATLFNARVIAVIHGDGEYSFHDSSGQHRRADEEILGQVRAMATLSSDTEVLIFHQMSNWGAGLFGLSEGAFYHYRYGTLQRKKTYFRGSGEFNAESKLIRRYAAPAALVQEGLTPSQAERARHIPTVLAYFGHEIPQILNNEGDSATMVVTRFTTGLKNLASPLAPSSTPEAADPKKANAPQTPKSMRPHKPYGLIVLSTCYGGTPRMMSALAPLADYAVASPAYLHLSHFDTRALSEVARLDTSTGMNPWKVLADTVAAHSFERLKKHTSTEITVAVYDLEATLPFARSFSRLYSKTYTKTDARTASSAARADSTGSVGDTWRDCATGPSFNAAQASRGVKLRYQPARFGVGKQRSTRSGWQCPY